MEDEVVYTAFYYVESKNSNKQPRRQETKLTDTENWLLVARGRGVRQMGEGGQKVKKYIHNK